MRFWFKRDRTRVVRETFPNTNSPENVPGHVSGNETDLGGLRAMACPSKEMAARKIVTTEPVLNAAATLAVIRCSEGL